MNLQAELSYLQAHLATLELPTPPPQGQQQQLMLPPALSIADLPTATSSVPATYDLSSLFDPMVHTSWTAMQQQQQRQMDLSRQFGGGGGAGTAATRVTGGGGEASSSGGGNGGGGSSGDLQELARELLHRHGSSSTVPCTESSPLPPPPHSK